jgi:putative ABC transport system substrate-binding protein
MQRREFITLLGGAAAAWPCAARAQQAAMPVIGFLGYGFPGPNSILVAAFREGLTQSGYIEGRNVAIEFRWAKFQASLASQLAADLVGRRVAVIVTSGSPYAATAAKAATSTVPIVFAVSDDPVKWGLVASFNRPGGNITGVNFLSAELAGKRLNLLLDLVPQSATVGYLSGPRGSPVFEDLRSSMLEAGHALGREITVLEVRRLDFEGAFASLFEKRVGALIVGNYTLFSQSRNQNKILELAARYKIPAIYPGRSYVINGGLMSYDSDAQATYRQIGAQYVGPILKGAKPADLPVQQPTKFDLVINLKTAKALGLTISPALLAIADEVIE